MLEALAEHYSAIPPDQRHQVSVLVPGSTTPPPRPLPGPSNHPRPPVSPRSTPGPLPVHPWSAPDLTPVYPRPNNFGSPPFHHPMPPGLRLSMETHVHTYTRTSIQVRACVRTLTPKCQPSPPCKDGAPTHMAHTHTCRAFSPCKDGEPFPPYKDDKTGGGLVGRGWPLRGVVGRNWPGWSAGWPRPV